MDVFEDKSWVKLRRLDENYMRLLDRFLDYAHATCAVENKIACPCRICGNRNYYEKEIVRAHMIMREMDVDYQKCIWNFHGESRVSNNDNLDDEFDYELDDTDEDDMVEMLGDAFEFHKPTSNKLGPNDEAQEFFKLIDDAGQPLYPNCQEFSKLSFTVEMYHLKCMYGVSDVAFDEFVKLFKRALPKDSTMPLSFKKMQTMMKKIGLCYNKIDVSK